MILQNKNYSKELKEVLDPDLFGSKEALTKGIKKIMLVRRLGTAFSLPNFRLSFHKLVHTELDAYNKKSNYPQKCFDFTAAYDAKQDAQDIQNIVESLQFTVDAVFKVAPWIKTNPFFKVPNGFTLESGKVKPDMIEGNKYMPNVHFNLTAKGAGEYKALDLYDLSQEEKVKLTFGKESDAYIAKCFSYGSICSGMVYLSFYYGNAEKIGINLKAQALGLIERRDPDEDQSNDWADTIMSQNNTGEEEKGVVEF